ncbi:Hsp90 protein-domain-containing protein [Cladochytrium replicatum]|nr:Hsp90 protein-domain-containing protein [Cladochytrium replicatum]
MRKPARILLFGLLAFFLLALLFSSVSASTEEDAVFNDQSDGGTRPITVEVQSSSSKVLPEDVKPLTDEDLGKAQRSGQKFEFQAEVNKMMSIIVRSLYKSKEIFLRELISNASDALDKIRFMSLTDKEALKGNPDLKISVVADPTRKTLTIRDAGVGMTKAELQKNLGTLAKSGTGEFIKALENKTADMGLIGQFGVGFYSVFLVADKVTVVSKNNNDKQHIWQAESESDFTIYEDPRGNTLGRGTEITLHLKEDAVTYLEDSTLETLIKKYSEFINFEIYLWRTKTKTEEVPDEDAKKEEDEKKDDLEVEDVEEEKPEKPKTKTITKTVHEWELMNGRRPLWTRNPKDVSETEYKDFYRGFTKDFDDPLTWIHFRAEGDLDFRGVLYIPSRSPPNWMNTVDSALRSIKLFVKRVFITDELIDFLPKYLGFLKGLVDSDDLPLNVSRETLQQHSLLKTIKKKVIQKALEMVKSLSADEEKYKRFIKEFGTALKFGVLEDAKNKKKLSKLLRFQSSKMKGENITSLDGYISRMKKGQPQIYYLTGSSVEEIERSPFVETLIGRGYEVLYMPDPIDEYLIQRLTTYENFPLQSAAKSGLKYGDEDEESSKSVEKLTETYKPLSEYIKTTLSEFVEEVKVSNRLTKSPAAIVAKDFAYTGNMERIMQAQAFRGDDAMLRYYASMKKIIEINPNHPLIESLLNKIQNEEGENPAVKEAVQVLYETTLLRSGFNVNDLDRFAARVETVVRRVLGVDLETSAEVDLKPAPEKDAEGESKTSEAEEVDEDDEKDSHLHDEL